MKFRLRTEVPFYIALILQIYYVVRIITINSYENSSVFVVLILIFSLLTIAGSNYNRREFTIFMILLACGGIHLLVAEDTNLLRIVLLVFSGKKVSGERLKKFLAIVYPVTFVSVWMLSRAGVLEIVQTSVWRLTVGWESRYTLGFDGATRMMLIWICCILSIQIFTNKTNIFRDLILLGVSIYLFTISISYTGLFGSLIALTMPYICNFVVKKKTSAALRYFVNISLIIVLGLTLLATVFDISNTAFGIFTNGRTYFLNYLFRNGPYPTLFGGEIPEVKGLDNSYFYNMYLLGIIPMCLMIYAIWRLGIVFYKKKDAMGTACTVTFVFIAYITQTFEHPFLNYFLFLIIENWKEFMNPSLLERKTFTLTQFTNKKKRKRLHIKKPKALKVLK